MEEESARESEGGTERGRGVFGGCFLQLWGREREIEIERERKESRGWIYICTCGVVSKEEKRKVGVCGPQGLCSSPTGPLI